MNFMNQKSYITFNPSADVGLYSIIKLSENNANAFILAVNAAPQFVGVASGTVAGPNIGKTIKIEFEKSGNEYSYLINGVAASVPLNLDPIFGTGDVYLSFGLSCKNAKPMQITVTKINGESLAYVESEDESESESSTAAPQTGDDSLLHFMLLMILPAALFTLAGARFIRKACR